jgi:hypothetical protein
MKAFLTKTLILVFGLGLTMTFTACHTSGDDASTAITKVDPTHSINGTVLTLDNQPLNDAVVKITDGNGSAVSVTKTGTGNTFTASGLKDGTYTITITCTTPKKYKSVTVTEPLVAEYIKENNGEKSGKNIDRTFYMSEDVTTTERTFSNSTSANDEIVIETTDYTDGDGNKGNDVDGNTEDGQITVTADIPKVSDDDYTDIDNQIKTQSGGTEDINDFKISLTNITSLEDAQAVAKANNVAESRMARANAFQTRATTAMPERNELLAGVAINAGRYVVKMPDDKPFVITMKMPEDVKGAITLFHTVKGDAWTKVDLDNPDPRLGIKDIDYKSTANIIKIQLKEVRTQSFGFGVIVNESQVESGSEDIVAKTFPNPNATSSYKLSKMDYSVKTGVVLGDYSKSSLSDFLRKMMIRKYGTRLVKQASVANKTYVFSPVYSMHPNGIMHLEGVQMVDKIKYSVANSNPEAYYNVTAYGEWYVFPYEEWYEVVVVHGGGSN